MRLLVLGCGLMGPAAAFNAMADPEVSSVVVCDANRESLEACARKLAGMSGAEKLTTALLDVNDEPESYRLLSGFDAAVGALPGEASYLGIRAALRAGVPLVDMARPRESQIPALGREAEAGGLAILGCGVEPGLTEIMARHLAERLDRVDEVHIKCGGIPEKPAPPLGYKIVFGGRELPLREGDALVVEGGQLRPVPRYSGVEGVAFPGVGEFEAWHEGFMPWLLDLPCLAGLRLGTQKTIRWPGYAAKVTVLREMGMLSLQPVTVDGAPVAPKKLLDALLYPRLRLEEGERDLTLFRVEVAGHMDGQPRRFKADMVDRYDDVLGFTSMARTTAFTAASVARMIGRGEIDATGLLTPEKILAGPLLQRLLADLARHGIRFDIAEETPATAEARP